MGWFRKSRTRSHKVKKEVFLGYKPDQPDLEVTGFSERVAWFEQQLERCSDVAVHRFVARRDVPGVVLYIQGMIDQQLIELIMENDVLQFIESGSAHEMSRMLSGLYEFPFLKIERTVNLNDAMHGLLDGQLLLILDGESDIYIFPIKKIEKRAITEPTTESVIRGPKESFIEDVDTNLTMIRRRIKHPGLKTETMMIGKYTQTKVVLMYLEGICGSGLVEEAKSRLERIQIDGVLGSNYLQEYLEDNPYSPFPQAQHTERPDTLAAAILEGRLAIFVDGTPIPILEPVTFVMLMQATEDYYQRYIIATWIRWIRYLFLFVSFLFPSIYIAITTFHPEMLPPTLLITVCAAREATPFPAIVEATLMELSFEALREGGLRIPKSIGQTISIIGALVIGQAAVEAGIVSASMVIVVSITGIASFIIPHYDLGLAFRLLRFPVMFMAATFGLLGIIVSIFCLYLHLINLRSFGTPYLAPIAPLRLKELKDVFVRVPWWKMQDRPHFEGSAGGARERKVQHPKTPGQWDGD